MTGSFARYDCFDAPAKEVANRMELTMFTFILRYVRYALTTLTTIGFGIAIN